VFLFPLQHEDLTARRWPWITTGLIIANALIFAATYFYDVRVEREVEGNLSTLNSYYSARPYLSLSKSMQKLILSDAKSFMLQGIEPPNDPERIAQEQTQLNAYSEAVEASISKLSFMRWGYRPNPSGWLTIITSMFLHGGLLHLFFNTWFLWLVGCNIEDAWGRVFFPLFYISAGIVAALVHTVGTRTSMLPMIGASGAVAGAMGAFLIRHLRTRIRFVALFWVRPVFFSAPAFLMLPLWLVTELLSALLDASGQGGVAYWAHVGGFVYGAVLAVGLRATGVEGRINAAIENVDSFEEHPHIAQAWGLAAERKFDEAIELLGALEMNARVHQALIQLYEDAGRRDAAHQQRLQLLEYDLQRGDHTGALELYQHMLTLISRSNIPAALRLRIARLYERLQNLQAAASEFEQIYAEHEGDVALSAIVARANLALKVGDKDNAQKLFEFAHTHYASHPSLNTVIREGLRRSQS